MVDGRLVKEKKKKEREKKNQSKGTEQTRRWAAGKFGTLC